MPTVSIFQIRFLFISFDSGTGYSFLFGANATTFSPLTSLRAVGSVRCSKRIVLLHTVTLDLALPTNFEASFIFLTAIAA